MDRHSQGMYLTSFQYQMLRDSLDRDLPAAQRQRLEIVMLTDAGKTQAEICRSLGCSAATASRWMQLTRAGLAHQYLDYPVGRPKVVTEEYIELLRELLDRSPKDYGYPFKTWTVSWLGKHIAKERGITVSHSHLKRVMRESGLSTRKSAQQPPSQPRTNISIGDLTIQPEARTIDRSLALNNLVHIQIDPIDTQIYGAAAQFSSHFTSAVRRNFSGGDYSAGLSILS
jgi:transposase